MSYTFLQTMLTVKKFPDKYILCWDKQKSTWKAAPIDITGVAAVICVALNKTLGVEIYPLTKKYKYKTYKQNYGNQTK